MLIQEPRATGTGILVTFGRDRSKDGIFRSQTRLVGAADGRAVRSRWFNFSHKKCPDEQTQDLAYLVVQFRLIYPSVGWCYHFPRLAFCLSIHFGDA